MTTYKTRCPCGNELEETKRGKRDRCISCSTKRFAELRKKVYERRDLRRLNGVPA